MSKKAAILMGFLLVIWNCSSDGGDSHPSEISVTMNTSSTTVLVYGSKQFTATVHNSTNNNVSWSISGSGCSGASCGVINTDGLYSAPGGVPDPPTVTIKATSAADSSKSASATVTITIPESPEWTWVSGFDHIAMAGIYGTKGTASPSNLPGTRNMAESWVDTSGKFWLFGGIGYDSNDMMGELNDLWRYDPTTNQWAWISGSNQEEQQGVYGSKGTPAASNVPGARRDVASWVDLTGKFWIFGGNGYTASSSGWMNDLWKFDPETNQWTWMAGSYSDGQAGIYGTKGIPSSSNIPGARFSSVSWLDSNGQFWLFGGLGEDSASNYSRLNDLWKYSPSSNQWTWISGSSVGDQPATYGTKGVPSVSNIPGGRQYSVSWTDSQGKLWLFGGLGYDSGFYSLNDLWRYDPVTNQWTWVSGSNARNQIGVYGARGLAAPSNIPGARSGSISWVDSKGNFWLFGGESFVSAFSSVSRNDLWQYNPTTNLWTWISGSNDLDQWGNYGTKGVSAPSNIPGARDASVSWIDSYDNLWLFGGWGYDKEGNQFYIGDLWRCIGIQETSTQYTLTVQASPSSGGTVSVSPNGVQFDAGTVVTLTATPGAGYVFSSWTGDLTGTVNPTTLTMNGNKTVTANFASSATPYTLTVQASPLFGGTITVLPNETQFAPGAVVTLTATAASGYSFDNWTGDAIGTDNPTTITMNRSMNVTANFASLTGYEYFVYVANDYVSSVSAFRVDASTGALTEISGSPFAAGSEPHRAAVDPMGRFLYVVNYASNNTSAYSIAPDTGVLNPTVGSPFAAGTYPWDITVDPTGKFAYVTEGNNVLGYTINSTTGALTAIAGSPFAAGYSATSVVIDPAGKFAYVTNYWSNDVSAYTVNSSTGALSPIAGSPYAAGSGPQSLTVDPEGKFLYVASQVGNVSAYSINPTTGTLSPIAGSPFSAGTNPFSIEVDPTGKYVYVANANSDTVSAYIINSATGALTEIVGSPFPAGGNPLSIAVDPTGKFAYVASGSYVIPYAINPASGVLTQLSGPHYLSGATRISIVTIGIRQ